MAKLKEFQEGVGKTGRFGEFFVGLGAFIALGGLLLATLGATATMPVWTTDAVHVDAVQAGVLFMLQGVGFTIFGIMAVRAGWARHHPEADG